jgi:hypothetical protein
MVPGGVNEPLETQPTHSSGMSPSNLHAYAAVWLTLPANAEHAPGLSAGFGPLVPEPHAAMAFSRTPSLHYSCGLAHGVFTHQAAESIRQSSRRPRRRSMCGYETETSTNAHDEVGVVSQTCGVAVS